MEGYAAATYGDAIADVYDEWYGAPMDRPAERALLVELAGAGPVLELGVGTGRVALALQAAGVEVHGIDASEAMVAQLRAKPGGADVPVTIGDMADVAAPGTGYTLVYVVFNTFFAILEQDDQVRAFARVAEVLAPGVASSPRRSSPTSPASTVDSACRPSMSTRRRCASTRTCTM